MFHGTGAYNNKIILHCLTSLIGDTTYIFTGEQHMQRKIHTLNLRHKDNNQYRTSCCYTFAHKELNSVAAEQMQIVAEFW